MTETANTNATPATAETAKPSEPTAEQLEEMFNSLPSEIQEAVNELNTAIAEHNKKVDSVKAAEAKDPKLIKAEIFEQNPDNNKKLARLYSEYLKLVQASEKLRDDAYKVIDDDGLMPKDLSEAEVTKLKTEVSESTKELRSKQAAMLQLEDMVPTFKGKLNPHIAEIKTRRGTAKTSSASGEGPKRLRFKKILVNDTDQDEKGNTVYGKNADGEIKYTFTFAAKYLNQQHKGINWVANDLTEAYLQGLDENNLPDAHEFTMPYKYTDTNGNEQTVNYTIKAYR